MLLPCERLSFVGVNDPGLATYYLFKRQIGRVATFTESDVQVVTQVNGMPRSL